MKEKNLKDLLAHGANCYKECAKIDEEIRNALGVNLQISEVRALSMETNTWVYGNDCLRYDGVRVYMGLSSGGECPIDASTITRSRKVWDINGRVIYDYDQLMDKQGKELTILPECWLRQSDVYAQGMRVIGNRYNIKK